MDLRRLEYFVAVAEELHFGRAADRLHVAQPPLSRQIQRLEAELGVQLFTRNRHGVEMTPAGAALLPEARGTLAQAERAGEIARRAARGEEGVLDIGFIASVAFTLLPRFTREYGEEHPNVELRLHDMASGQQLEALRDGRLDVGLMMQPYTAPDLNLETVLVEPIAVVVPHGHRLAERESVRLAELADEPFVLMPHAMSPDLHDRLMALCAEAGFRPRIVQEATHMATIVSLIAAGAGVSLMPASISAINRPDVACVNLTDPEVKAWIAMAWPRSNGSAALPSFLDSVRSLTH